MDFPEVIGRGLQGKRGKRVTCSPAATIIIYNIFFLPFVLISMLTFLTDNILFSYILMFSFLVRLFAVFL